MSMTRIGLWAAAGCGVCLLVFAAYVAPRVRAAVGRDSMLPSLAVCAGAMAPEFAGASGGAQLVS